MRIHPTDVKLGGMRATSPHYLGLYPPEVYNLYTQIKPGLIPPIFDEETGGFEEIVRVDLEYLRRYWEAPIRTDIVHFRETIGDVFLRRVLSG